MSWKLCIQYSKTLTLCYLDYLLKGLSAAFLCFMVLKIIAQVIIRRILEKNFVTSCRSIIGTILAFLLAFASVSIAAQNAQNADAVGTWNGQDTLRVPMSWCAVNGSQAADSPNIPVSPDSPSPTDTTTDGVLWRRHERPTDNIFANPAGITLRSAINNAWGSLNFPLINDPDTSVGVQGDILSPTISTTEFNQIIQDCRTAWDNLGRAGIGTTAVNINLFPDSAGNYVHSGNFIFYGFGGCPVSSTTGICSSPYGGHIVVIDNHYLFPGITNRDFPGTTTHFALTDPIDQAVGHEMGHALSLSHRTDSTRALMFPSHQDNDGNGRVDNTELNNNEVTNIRSSAQVVPGLERDPTGQIVKGDIVETIKTDKATIEQREKIPSFLDVAEMRVALDKKNNQVSFGQQLFGIIPAENKNAQYWTLVDSDNNPDTGAGKRLLLSVGAPSTNFRGADFVIKAEVSAGNITGSIWQFQEGKLVMLPENEFQSDLLTNIIHVDCGFPERPSSPDGAEITGNLTTLCQTPSLPDIIPVSNIISVTVNNTIVGIELNKPFNIQALSAVQNRSSPIDKLDSNASEAGVKFVLENPSFPQCFVKSDAKQGETVAIDVQGLLPDSNIHGLLGPRPVFNGQTDSNGNATIQFPIPDDATPGLHLVTIGVDNTALTADCEVNVLPREVGGGNVTKTM
jgi:hypothetical protein